VLLCLVNEVYVLQFFFCRYRVAEIAWVQDNPPEGLEQRTEVYVLIFLAYYMYLHLISVCVCECACLLFSSFSGSEVTIGGLTPYITG